MGLILAQHNPRGLVRAGVNYAHFGFLLERASPVAQWRGRPGWGERYFWLLGFLPGAALAVRDCTQVIKKTA
jgi:hypothetical protein